MGFSFFGYGSMLRSCPPGYEADERSSLGERPDRRRWREEGGERVTRVGEGRRRTVAKDIRRAPQQGTSNNAKGVVHLKSTRRSHTATNNANRKRYRFEKPRNHNGFWVFSCLFQGAIQKISFHPNDLWGGLELPTQAFRGRCCVFFARFAPFFVSGFVKCLCLGGCA